MKYLVIAIGLVALVSCSGEQGFEIGNKTTMEITPAVFDAGEVIRGEVINAKFTLKNTGEYPLVIGSVNGTCSCTVAEYPEEPIQPGETGSILAHVNTNEIGVGPLSKGVNIVANVEQGVVKVSIRASVMRN